MSMEPERKDRQLACKEWVKDWEPSEGTQNPRGPIAPHIEMNSAESPNLETVQGPQGVESDGWQRVPPIAPSHSWSVCLHWDT